LDNDSLPPPEDRAIDVSGPLRTNWAEALVYALGKCHPVDALSICADFIGEYETGGPELAAFSQTTVRDARWWADIAPPHELVAYGMAALDRLGVTPLGQSTRKKLFVALWESFSEVDRVRFAKRIDPEGMVIRRGHD